MKETTNLEEIPEQHLCFWKCLMEKEGEIDADGVIQKEKIAEHLSIPQIAKEKQQEVQTCIENVEKIENCGKVVDVLKCFPFHNKKH